MSETLDEHFSYLNLKGRFDLYQQAIDRTVSTGDLVADLGCGVGVLGLQCLDAGADRVIGIDYSDAIELARETFTRAGLADRYQALRGSTFRTVLPEPVDVIICDHVGFFGIDYGIVEMLQDARQRMLKPGGAIIPRRIELHVAGVSSDSCATAAQAWTGAGFPEHYHWLNGYTRNTKHPRDFSADELCTAPVAIGMVSLESDEQDFFAMTGTIAVDHDCRFDGLAGWFNAELAEGVWMTNSPLVEDRLARHNVFLPCLESFAVRAGEEIAVSLRFRTDGEMIAWSVTTPGGKPQRMSTWNSRVLTPADLASDSGRPPVLTRSGRGRLALLDLVDGQRTVAEIEAEMLSRHPDLFPTTEELGRFIRRELGHSTE